MTTATTAAPVDRAARRQAAIDRINAARTVSLECYLEAGADDRFSYFEGLADEHDVKVSTVARMASFLGPDEDFDGLVTHLEDGFYCAD